MITKAEEWRQLQKELEVIFKEKDLSYFKATKQFLEKQEDPVILHASKKQMPASSDGCRHQVYSDSVYKLYWKDNADKAPEDVKYPQTARLTAAIKFLTALRKFLLEEDGICATSGRILNEREMIEAIGLDAWNKFRRDVIQKTKEEEMSKHWGK